MTGTCYSDETRTFWITGLSASGKSTLGALLCERIESLPNRKVVHLDGESIRRSLKREYGFTPEERFCVVKEVVDIVRRYNGEGFDVVVSIISHKREMREYARKKIPNFIEVHLRCPVQVCARRDKKGHYRRAFDGEYDCFVGVTDPYEETEFPEYVIDTDLLAPEASVAQLLREYEEGRGARNSLTYDQTVDDSKTRC